MRGSRRWLAGAVALAVASPGHAVADEAPATAPTGVVHTVRKSMTYFPMVDAANTPRESQSQVERAVRLAVEQSRFDINDLDMSLRGLTLAELAQATRQYVDEIKLQRAAAGAEYDVRFKDLTITADMLRRIADSAFVYAPTIEHWSVDHAVSYITRAGVWLSVDTYAVAVRVRVPFYRIDFATGQPVLEYTVTAIGHGESSSSPPLVTQSMARQNAIAEALDSLYVDGRTKVRSLPPFQLKVNVERATAAGGYFPLTAKDGLVPDTLLRVEELNEKDEHEVVGWMIVREVGDGVTEAQSYAGYIATYDGFSLTGGEMLYEVPQKGYGVAVEGYYGAMRIDGDTSGSIGAAGHIGGLRLLATRHLAEETGIHGFGIAAKLSLGFVGDFAEFNGEVGAEQSWNFRRLFFSAQLRAGGLRSWTGVFATSAWVNSFGVSGEGRVWAWLTPNWSFGVHGSYRAYVPTDMLSFNDDTFIVAVPGFRYNPSGWQLGAGPTFRF